MGLPKSHASSVTLIKHSSQQLQVHFSVRRSTVSNELQKAVTYKELFALPELSSMIATSHVCLFKFKFNYQCLSYTRYLSGAH